MRKATNKEHTIAALRGRGPFSFSEKQEAIVYSIQSAFLSSQGLKPGVIIESLPKDIRDTLKDCTSEDWQHRLDDYTRR